MRIFVEALLEEVVFKLLDQRMSQKHVVPYAGGLAELVPSCNRYRLVRVDGSADPGEFGAKFNIDACLAPSSPFMYELNAFFRIRSGCSALQHLAVSPVRYARTVVLEKGELRGQGTVCRAVSRDAGAYLSSTSQPVLGVASSARLRMTVSGHDVQRLGISVS